MNKSKLGKAKRANKSDETIALKHAFIQVRKIERRQYGKINIVWPKHEETYN
jgi:hypothetical protein